MKSKDIINEGLFSDFERAAYQFKQAYDTRKNATTGLGGRVKALFSPTRMKYGRSTKDQVAANKFIDKFVSQALETLDVAVKNDLVDATSNKLGAAPTQQPPAAPQPAGKKPQAKAKQPAAKTTPEPITFGREKYTKGPKGWIDSKGKPADENTAKILDQAAQKATAQNQPKQPAAQQAAQQKAPATTAPAAKTKKAVPKAAVPKAAVPKAAAPKAAAAPAQPRQTVTQKIAPQLQAKAARKVAGKRNQPMKEDLVYEKLNLLFESYMELIEASSVPQGGGRIKGAGLSQTPNAIRKREARAKAKAAGQQSAAPAQPAQPAQEPAEEKLSISAYFKENFLDDFLQGIDMGPAKPKIDALLKNLPSLYGTGQLKKELETIANIAWTLAKK